jgi:hypothetical protein
MNCKEDISLYFIVIGIWCFLYLKKRQLGILLTLFSTIFFIFIITVAMPHFSTNNSLFNFQDMYPSLGNSSQEITQTIISAPHQILKTLFSAQSLSSLTYLLAPFLVFFLFGGSTTMLCLLPFSVKLLATYIATIKFTKHAIWHPLFFIYFASIFGIRKIRLLITKKLKFKQNFANIFLALILVIATFLNLFFWQKFTFYTYRSYHPLSYYLSKQRTELRKQALSLIPKQASLFADAEFFSYFPNRHIMYEINQYHPTPIINKLEETAYCIFDSEAQNTSPLKSVLKPQLQLYLNIKFHWQKIFSQDGVVVFKNINKTGE